MGGPDVAIAAAILSAASTGAAAAGQKAQANQVAKAQTLQQHNRNQALERQQRAAEIRRQSEERQLESQRRQALATRRARFGAGGVSSNSGSASALLSGLNKQFDEQQAAQEDLYDLQRQEFASQQAVNTQNDLLAETRAKTQSRLASFGEAETLAKTGLSLLPS